MKKRIKMKRKTALNISLLTGAIWCIVATTLGVLYAGLGDGDIFHTVTSGLIIIFWMLCLPMITYFYLDMIFQVEEGEKINNTFLNKDDFTEVFYEASNWNTSEGEMILNILEKEEIKFLAKLMEEEKILLVVKNKNNEEIFSCEISDFDYFEDLFQKEKN